MDEKKTDDQFLSKHYRTLLNIIALVIVLRIECQGVTCVMSNDDTINKVRNNKVLVESNNLGFAKGSDNGWIFCQLVSQSVSQSYFAIDRKIYKIHTKEKVTKLLILC